MNSAMSFESATNSPDSSQEAVVDPHAASYNSVQFHTMNLRAMLFNSPSINHGEPYLKVLEEPVDKFRFRYKSEMMGTHGSILARSHERNRRKIYPSVQICNYDRPAIVRCSLYTAQSNERTRTPHTHRLIVRDQNNMDKDDPHELIVSQDNNYTAIFHGMGIIHTAKKNIVEELIKKKRSRLLEKLRAININIKSLNTAQETQLKQEAEDEARKMNLNSVSLCFEAFDRDVNNCVKQITKPVFSKPINNMKSALTGELKICRIDKHVSSCMGGEEVFVLVEKVGKKNIKVKFFEVNDDDNEIWHDYGKFSELDVHHQYAIVFRTPPYRDLEIEKTVDVYLQLYRPTDGDCSEPIRFQYKPSDKMGRTRKRQRMGNECLSSADQNIRLLNEINGGMNGPMDLGIGSKNPSDVFLGPENISINDLLGENTDLNSTDFQEFLRNFSITSIQEYINTFDASSDITCDGEAVKPTSNSIAASYAERTKESIEVPVSNAERTKQSIEVAASDADKTEQSMEVAASDANKTEQSMEVAASDADKTEQSIEFIASDIEKIEHSIEVAVSDIEKTEHSIKVAPSDAEKLVQSFKIKTEEEEPVVKRETIGDFTLLQTAIVQMNMVLQEKLPAEVIAKKVEEIFNMRNTEGDGALHAGVMTGQNDAVKLMLQVLGKVQLLSLVNSVNFNSETPLHLSVLHNQPGFIKMLLTKGADVNCTNGDGNTCIHLAIRCGHNECLTVLLDRTNYTQNNQPKLDEKNYAGQTPLHLSALKRNLFAVKKLVESGADVNAVDSTFNRHVLLVAVQEGCKEIVEYLVKETNVDVNLPNNDGNTPLHYACVVGDGNKDICKLLIEAKADPLKANYEQRSKAAELPLGSLLIKEEVESEDEFLQLRIDDDDDDEDEEEEDDDDDDDDDDDEEEEDDDDESSKGMTSIDLARNKKEILQILQQADQYMAQTLINEENEVEVKEECSSPSDTSTIADNGLFDEETLGKLCVILDKSSWAELADLLEYTFLVPSIKNSTSPTKLLFNYADLHGNVTIQDIRNHLETLDQKEAMEVIDLMLARQVASSREHQ